MSVDLSGFQGSGGQPGQPQEEKKRGGLLPWGATGSPGVGGVGFGNAGFAASVPSRLAMLAKIPGLKGFITSGKIFAVAKASLAALAVGGVGLSGYGLYDMGRRGGFANDPTASAGANGVFDQREPAGKTTEVGIFGGNAAASALDLARSANEGSMGAPGEEAVVDDFADAAQDDGAGEGAEGEGEAEGGPDAAAMAAGMVGDMAGKGEDAAKDAEKAAAGGLGKMSGLSGLGGGSGGSGASLGGGAGMAGGIGQGFKQPGLSNSQLQAMRAGRSARTSRGRAARMKGGKLQGLKSKSGDRLAKMAGNMSSGAGNPETAAAANTGAWENQPASGESLQGSGAGGGIGGGGFNSDEGGVSGGPTDGNTSSGGGNNTGGDYGNTDVPDVGGGMNVTPYQFLIDLATIIHGIVTILLLTLAVLALIAKVSGPFSAAVAPMILAMLKIAMWLSVMEALIGVAIMAMGQTAQGALFTSLGTLTAICAYISIADGTAGMMKWKATTVLLTAGLGGLAHGALGATAAFGVGDHQAFHDDADDGDDGEDDG